ncbi:Uncharacterised protein [Clostridium baratii]|uniref:hypothetical protein n=1 Tax=Clostridium baratii TaxID=1561 RepID=UPI0006C6D475|nr:hypothetical protein [Clostridium baratii]CUP05496.1 Uncharacterised protein [Clostridium baratii]
MDILNKLEELGLLDEVNKRFEIFDKKQGGGATRLDEKFKIGSKVVDEEWARIRNKYRALDDKDSTQAMEYLQEMNELKELSVKCINKAKKIFWQM